MENLFKHIDEIIKSAPPLTIDINGNGKLPPLKLDDDERKDHRIELIKEEVNQFKEKDNNFYTELIKLMASYLGELYDYEIEMEYTVLDENDNQIEYIQDIIEEYKSRFHSRNRTLSKNLYNYICDILKENKEIKLDIELLKKLFNIDPKPSTLYSNGGYYERDFDFKRLASILKENETLEKSNIGINDIYQLLLDSYQIAHEDIFTALVTPENFNKDHKKIDEVLTSCTPRLFAILTSIIVNNYDENYDRMSLLKQNQEKKDYIEHTIIEFFDIRKSDKDYDFIHKILTDESININYDLFYADYMGSTDLRSIIAFNSNKIIIQDFLRKPENIRKYYRNGFSIKPLYSLYVTAGDLENALNSFEETYNYRLEFSIDSKGDISETGWAYGDINYENQLAEFIKYICESLEKENTKEQDKKAIISRILNCERVKFIDIEKTLPIIKETLTKEEFNQIIEELITRYNNNQLNFITVNESRPNDSIYRFYTIQVANEEEVKLAFSKFSNEESNIKKLNKKRKEEQ